MGDTRETGSLGIGCGTESSHRAYLARHRHPDPHDRADTVAMPTAARLIAPECMRSSSRGIEQVDIPPRPHHDGDVPVRTYVVPGISCEHCKAAIESEVVKVSDVDRVAVDIDATNVTLTGGPTNQAVREAIETAGYDVGHTID